MNIVQNVWVGVVLVGAMTVVAAGCSDEAQRPASTATVSFPTGADLPAAQRDALADGEVTANEYASAFDAFVTCAKDAGGSVKLESSDPVSGVILYSTGSPIGSPREPNVSSVEGRCYDETFSWIDLVFQSSPAAVEQGLADELEHYQSEVRPCLVANAVEAPENVEIGSQAYGELLDQFVDLSNRGLC